MESTSDAVVQPSLLVVERDHQVTDQERQYADDFRQRPAKRMRRRYRRYALRR